jgi:hypothetical protein
MNYLSTESGEDPGVRNGIMVALRTVVHEHHGMRSNAPRSRTPIR